MLAGMNIIAEQRFNDKAFWKQLAPKLHIEDDVYYRGTRQIREKQQYFDDCKKQMLEEGYFELRDFDHSVKIDRMANLVKALAEQKIPLVFGFVYDEFWAIYYSMHPLLRSLLDDNYLRLPDFWVWHIDPTTSESGWDPHRDKGAMSLFDNGRPKSLTAWIALTEATPLNGCMYLVPAGRDPQYGKPPPNPDEFALQDIRALPGKAGTAFIWNQCVLHWGAHASPRAPQPRISIAMEFQTSLVPPMNNPLSNPNENIPFQARLNLIAKQILQYRHMYPVRIEMENWAQVQLMGAGVTAI